MNLELIRDYERRINEFHRRIDETVAHRYEGPAQWKEWEEACRAWHIFESPINELWTSTALVKIEKGEGQWRDFAMTFLEADPWHFRSGYLKERLTKALKRSPLSREERSRVQKLLLRVVDSRPRREFRNYCRLAISVADTDFANQLKLKLASADKGIRLRAAWMLDYISKSKFH